MFQVAITTTHMTVVCIGASFTTMTVTIVPTSVGLAVLWVSMMWFCNPH